MKLRVHGAIVTIALATSAACHHARPLAANGARWVGPDDVEEIARIFHGTESCGEPPPPNAPPTARATTCGPGGWRAATLLRDPADPAGPVLSLRSSNLQQCRAPRFADDYDVSMTTQWKTRIDTYAALRGGPLAGACVLLTTYPNGAGVCDVVVYGPHGALGSGKQCRADLRRLDRPDLFRDGDTH
jgi:hypothetical protein